MRSDPTPPMDAARFAELARAYGANLLRWPDAERAGAETFAAVPEEEIPAEAELIWREALLDAELDIWQIAKPDEALIDRIAATATAVPPRRPTHVALPPFAIPRLPKPQLWWPAMGLGMAGVLGLLFGLATTSKVAPPRPARDVTGYEWSYEQPVDVDATGNAA